MTFTESIARGWHRLIVPSGQGSGGTLVSTLMNLLSRRFGLPAVWRFFFLPMGSPG